jgi:hypothetical protein
MDEEKNIISSDLQTQWQDHFHMRDQTWKVLHYSILFFIGIVGLEIKEVNKICLILAYVALFLTSTFGAIVAFHHRRRQKEKFEIIAVYEHKLGIDKLIGHILEKAHSKWINTSIYIVMMQVSLCILSACLLVKKIMS